VEQPPLTEIESALVDSASDPADRARYHRFTGLLLAGTVGVPGQVVDGSFAPDLRVHGERRYAVAFTHPARFDSYARGADLRVGPGSGVEVRSIPVRELWGQLVSHNLPLLLNPLNGYGKEFTVAEMSDLLQGQDPVRRERVVAEATTVMVGAPAVVPPGLTDRLTAYFDSVGDVRSATLAWIRYPDGMEGYVLGVRGSAGRERLLPGFDSVVGDLAGRTLDVAIAGESEPLVTDPVGAFYVRS
jgi:hypothetical protein